MNVAVSVACALIFIGCVAGAPQGDLTNGRVDSTNKLTENVLNNPFLADFYNNLAQEYKKLEDKEAQFLKQLATEAATQTPQTQEAFIPQVNIQNNPFFHETVLPPLTTPKPHIKLQANPFLRQNDPLHITQPKPGIHLRTNPFLRDDEPLKVSTQNPRIKLRTNPFLSETNALKITTPDPSLKLRENPFLRDKEPIRFAPKPESKLQQNPFLGEGSVRIRLTTPKPNFDSNPFLTSERAFHLNNFVRFGRPQETQKPTEANYQSRGAFEGTPHKGHMTSAGVTSVPAVEGVQITHYEHLEDINRGFPAGTFPLEPALHQPESVREPLAAFAKASELLSNDEAGEKVIGFQRGFAQKPEKEFPSSEVQPTTQIGGRTAENSGRIRGRGRPAKIEVTTSAWDEEARRQAENAKYSFAADVADDINGNVFQRAEIREGKKVEGKYSYSDGYLKRTVHYEADDKGFRVVKELVEELDGPKYNPNGTARVAAVINGNTVKYEITKEDLQRRSSNLRNLKSV